MRSPVVIFSVLALATLAVGTRAWIGAGQSARRELDERGEGIANVLVTALAESTERARLAEEREAMRLATVARRLQAELKRPLGPAAARLERWADEERLGRAFLFAADGSRVARVARRAAAAPPGDEEPDPRAEAEWARAREAVAPLLAGTRTTLREGIRLNVFATTHRIAAGLRLDDGGALLVEGDAEDVAALRRGADATTVLADLCRLPDVAGASITAGEEVVAVVGTLEGGPLHVRTLLLEGGPPLEARLALSTTRVDGILAAERRGILLWVALALGGAGGGAWFLWRRTLAERREAARRDAEAREQRRLAEMGVLTGLIVHEVSNPLNALSLTLGNLQQKVGDAAPEEIERMRRTLGKARTALESFLHLASSLEPAGGAGYSASSLRRTVAEIQEEFRGTPLEVDVGGSALALATAAREAAVDAAVRNVLRNAVQASPPGTGVRVRWSGTAPGRLEIRIEDQGPGFPPTLLAEGPSLGASGRPQGHGLGLYLARRTVENAGGRLRLENAPPGGAVAVLELPTSDAGTTS